jgi:hypothetical protein
MKGLKLIRNNEVNFRQEIGVWRHWGPPQLRTQSLLLICRCSIADNCNRNTLKVRWLHTRDKSQLGLLFSAPTFISLGTCQPQHKSHSYSVSPKSQNALRRKREYTNANDVNSEMHFWQQGGFLEAEQARIHAGSGAALAGLGFA